MSPSDRAGAQRRAQLGYKLGSASDAIASFESSSARESSQLFNGENPLIRTLRPGAAMQPPTVQNVQKIW